MAGLAALPLEARRLLPESILALLQCRERQDARLSPTFDDSSLPGEVSPAAPALVHCACRKLNVLAPLKAGNALLYDDA